MLLRNYPIITFSLAYWLYVVIRIMAHILGDTLYSLVGLPVIYFGSIAIALSIVDFIMNLYTLQITKPKQLEDASPEQQRAMEKSLRNLKISGTLHELSQLIARLSFLFLLASLYTAFGGGSVFFLPVSLFGLAGGALFPLPIICTVAIALTFVTGHMKINAEEKWKTYQPFSERVKPEIALAFERGLRMDISPEVLASRCDEQEGCSICMCDFEKDEPVGYEFCGPSCVPNIYHEKCYNEWAKQSSNRPVNTEKWADAKLILGAYCQSDSDEQLEETNLNNSHYTLCGNSSGIYYRNRCPSVPNVCRIWEQNDVKMIRQP